MSDRKPHRLRLSSLFVYLLLVFLVFLSIVPFYSMIVNGTHSNYEIATSLNLGFGRSLAENYATMGAKINIWRGFLNSLCVSIPYTLFTGYFGALTAYGFAKFRFRGRKALFWLVLASMMMPSQLSIIGFYRLNLSLNTLDTFIPFIIPGIANATATFFLKGIIEQSVPESILESGRIEGCGELAIFNRLVLPCITPGVATMCIFNFVASWNNYLGPLVILTDRNKYTMPVMIATIKGLYQNNYGAMYLAISISIVPIIVIYLFCSKYLVAGLTMGSDK
jgi:multiple sugar transport system permease protein